MLGRDTSITPWQEFHTVIACKINATKSVRDRKKHTSGIKKNQIQKFKVFLIIVKV